MKNKLIKHYKYSEIEIKNKNKVIHCLIDNIDIPIISQHSWYICSKGYVACKSKGKNIYLHRFLLNPPTNMQVNHINHNRLDNRRENLRICTQSENLKNRKFSHKGNIQIDKYESKKGKGITWYLAIVYNRRRHYMGKFKSYDEAFIFGSKCVKNIAY